MAVGQARDQLPGEGLDLLLLHPLRGACILQMLHVIVEGTIQQLKDQKHGG